MADYPAAITELRRITNRNGAVYDPDKKSLIFAEDFNYTIAEIEAIETVLGIDPAGSEATVVARLEAIEGRLDDLEAAGYITATSSTTLTNKRITARIGTVESSATPTPTGDSSDVYTITALAAAAELQTPSGTPTNGQKLIIRIKDNGTARALTYSAGYRAVGVTLPTTTVISKELYLGCIYNSASSKWEVLAVAQE